MSAEGGGAFCWTRSPFPFSPVAHYERTDAHPDGVYRWGLVLNLSEMLFELSLLPFGILVSSCVNERPFLWFFWEGAGSNFFIPSPFINSRLAYLRGKLLSVHLKQT